MSRKEAVDVVNEKRFRLAEEIEYGLEASDLLSSSFGSRGLSRCSFGCRGFGRGSLSGGSLSGGSFLNDLRADSDLDLSRDSSLLQSKPLLNITLAKQLVKSLGIPCGPLWE